MEFRFFFMLYIQQYYKLDLLDEFGYTDMTYDNCIAKIPKLKELKKSYGD